MSMAKVNRVPPKIFGDANSEVASAGLVKVSTVACSSISRIEGRLYVLRLNKSRNNVSVCVGGKDDDDCDEVEDGDEVEVNEDDDDDGDDFVNSSRQDR